MYRYSGCRYPYPHRLTGDGHRILMAGMRLFERTPQKPRAWTDEEEAILIEMYRKCKPISYIADVLDRDDLVTRAHAILLQKRGKLERRPNIQVKRSQQRRAFIKRHYQERGIKYCMRHLGLARNTVRTYAEQLKLPTRFKDFPWTKTEVEFLQNNYKQGLGYCAYKISRSLAAVQYKACKLGLTHRAA